MADSTENLADATTIAVVRAAKVPTPAGRAWTFSWRGAEIAVEEFGDGPRTFLLVHGIGMGRIVFAELIDDLRHRGRVIAIDQPGYGESPEPARVFTMERTADMLAALLRERGVAGVVAIGHSMGTQVVTELAVRHPGLVGTTVLIAPTVDSSARRIAVQIVRLVQDLWGESPKVMLLGGREYLRAGPNLGRKMRAMMTHRPECAYPRLASPTLVLRGAHDRVVPAAWARKVAGLIPGAAYDELPGTSHQSMIRDAGPTTRRIARFLEEHPPRHAPRR